MWPSELVTIGLLFALKGCSFRSFYRWLERDSAELYGGLPERTRLLRALRVQQHHTQAFLADPTFFTVIDTYSGSWNWLPPSLTTAHAPLWEARS